MTGRILVVCGAGASSTFLAHRLRSLAAADGRDIEVTAGSVDALRVDAAGMHVVLVGPHLADRLDAVRRAAEDEGAAAILLDADAFTADGARTALDRALAVLHAGAGAGPARLSHGRPAGGAPPAA